MKLLRFAVFAVALIILSMFVVPWYRLFDVPANEDGLADPRVVGAITDARRRWPEFLEALSHKEPHAVAAVARLFPAEEGGREWIWIAVTSVDGQVVHGTIATDPQHRIGYAKSDAVAISVSEIVDWEYADFGARRTLGPVVEPVLMKVRAERKR